MLNTLRMECLKAFANPWFFISAAIGCGLAIASAVMSAINFHDWGFDAYDPTRYLPLSSSGSFGAAWIGSRELDMSFIPTFFFSIAPLLAAIPYAWSLRTELASGYINQCISRVPRGVYLFTKGIATFLSGGTAIALPLIINFIALSCLIPGYVPDAGDGLRVGIMASYPFSELYFNAPIAYILVYTAYDFVLCGIWAVFVTGLSVLIDNRVVLLAGSYLGLYAINYLNEAVLPALTNYAQLPQFNLISAINPIPTICSPDVPLTCLIATASLAISALLITWKAKRDML